MGSLGRVLMWNLDGSVKQPFGDFEAAVGKAYVGINRRTLYQSLCRNVKKSSGFLVTPNNDQSIAILRVAKRGNRDTQGVQVANIPLADKYTISAVGMEKLPEWYNPDVIGDADMNGLERTILESEDETRYIVSGMISDNTARHVALGLCRGILVRREGGVYFVTNGNAVEFDEYIEKVRAFVGSNNLQVMSIPVENTASGVQAITTAAKADIFARMTDIMEQVQERTTRRGWDTQLGEIRDLINLLDIYDTALGVKMDDIRAQVMATQAMIKLKVQGIAS